MSAFNCMEEFGRGLIVFAILLLLGLVRCTYMYKYTYTYTGSSPKIEKLGLVRARKYWTRYISRCYITSYGIPINCSDQSCNSTLNNLFISCQPTPAKAERQSLTAYGKNWRVATPPTKKIRKCINIIKNEGWRNLSRAQTSGAS